MKTGRRAKPRRPLEGSIRFTVGSRTIMSSPRSYDYQRTLLLATERYDGRKWVPIDSSTQRTNRP